MSETAQIFYGIKEIGELSFAIDNAVSVPPNPGLEVRYDVQMQTVVADETVRITIEPRFMFIGHEAVFLHGKSFTTFIIRDIRKYSRIHDGQELVDLPDPMWITLFSIAYTHTRAILAKSAAGTKFSGIYLPLINPELEFRKVFAAELAKYQSAAS